jgi:hypothetical protein
VTGPSLAMRIVGAMRKALAAENHPLPMSTASHLWEAIEPEVDALVEENRRLLAALERVSTWADGMEIDFEGQPSIYGKAIAKAVRDAIRGDVS